LPLSEASASRIGASSDSGSSQSMPVGGTEGDRKFCGDHHAVRIAHLREARIRLLLHEFQFDRRDRRPCGRQVGCEISHEQREEPLRCGRGRCLRVARRAALAAEEHIEQHEQQARVDAHETESRQRLDADHREARRETAARPANRPSWRSAAHRIA
jgi:hypothetical protein